MQNEQLWRKLEEDQRVRPKATLKHIAIGIIAGIILHSGGWMAVLCHSNGQVNKIERRIEWIEIL